MTRLTGALPDRQSSRERDRVDFNYRNAGGAPTTAGSNDYTLHPIAWIRTQGGQSCVGQSCAEVGDAAKLSAPWLSAVSIWREARRRQGKIESILEGTRVEYALEGLAFRGWDPYVPGEEQDEVEAGLGAPDAGDDLADELFAGDKTDPNLERYRIYESDAGLLDALDHALDRGVPFGVIVSSGLKQPYLNYVGDPSKPDVIMGADHLGGEANGHAERICGRWRRADGSRLYLKQNHWSTAWGGCHLPDGTWLPGCVWMNETAVLAAWDFHVVRINT